MLQKDTANMCSRLRNENFIMLEGKIYREEPININGLLNWINLI